MRLLLIIAFFSVAALTQTSNAQTVNVEEFAEFLASTSEIVKTRWTTRYDENSRILTLWSNGRINGYTINGNGPGWPMNLPVNVVIRVVQQPNAVQKEELKEVLKEISDYRRGMSENASAFISSPIPPKTLSKSEWQEVLEFSELRRRAHLLALPTHTYKSLHFSVAEPYVRPTKKQTPDAAKLLEDRERILKLLTPYE